MTDFIVEKLNEQFAGMGAPVEARATKDRGIGLFATKDVKKGDYVLKERTPVSFNDYHLHEILINNPPEELETSPHMMNLYMSLDAMGKLE